MSKTRRREVTGQSLHWSALTPYPRETTAGWEWRERRVRRRRRRMWCSTGSTAGGPGNRFPLSESADPSQTHSFSSYFTQKWKVGFAMHIFGHWRHINVNSVLHFRTGMTSSVNAMICLDTVYRLLYTFIIHWRTINMTGSQHIFSAWLDRDQVGCFGCCLWWWMMVLMWLENRSSAKSFILLP